MFSLRRLISVLLFSACSAGQSHADNEDLFSGLREARLLTLLEAEAVERPGRGAKSVSSPVTGHSRLQATLKIKPGNSAGVTGIRLAVYPTIDEAKETFQVSVNEIPIVYIEPKLTFAGDEFYVYGSAERANGRSGSFALRRRNTVLGITMDAAPGGPTIAELAKKLDKWLLEDRELAPLIGSGKFPRIKSVATAASIRRPASPNEATRNPPTAAVNIELEGQTPLDKCTVAVVGRPAEGGAGSVGGGQRIGPGAYSISAHPSARLGKHKLQVLVITPANLILTASTDVEVR